VTAGDIDGNDEPPKWLHLVETEAVSIWWSRTPSAADMRIQVKNDIHPNYDVANVTCSCGNTFQTKATVSSISVELCDQCHPFYTGQQKLVDTGGRVERFQKRYGARKTK
jgi:large subunit ribosomal protein L31